MQVMVARYSTLVNQLPQYAAANTSVTDRQTVVNSTLNGTTRFQAPTVYVNASKTDIAAVTDRATVDMGILPVV